MLKYLSQFSVYFITLYFVLIVFPALAEKTEQGSSFVCNSDNFSIIALDPIPTARNKSLDTLEMSISSDIEKDCSFGINYNYNAKDGIDLSLSGS